MNLCKELIRKYGAGLVIGAATLDGYRRQVISDRNSKIFKAIETKTNELQEA